MKGIQNGTAGLLSPDVEWTEAEGFLRKNHVADYPRW
ncbi:hypothetical protein FHW92_000798 [Novosphingobium sp. SG707]|nr:hypothetical protein [Novosphingobium sp. SG707]